MPCHFFKIATPVCNIFGTIERRDILNMPVASFSSMPNTNDNNKSVTRIYFFGGQGVIEIDFINIIVSFKDLFDVSLDILLAKHIRYMLIPYLTPTKHFRDTSLQSKSPTTAMFCCCSRRSYKMASFSTLLQSILFSSSSRLVLPNM